MLTHLVPDKGLEPLRLAAREPKSRVSANSANPANNWGELNWLSYSRRTFLLSKEICGFYIRRLHHKALHIKWVSREPVLLKPVFRRHLYFSILVAWSEETQYSAISSIRSQQHTAFFYSWSRVLANICQYGTQRKIKRFVWLNFIGYISVSLPFSRWMQRLLRLQNKS